MHHRFQVSAGVLLVAAGGRAVGHRPSSQDRHASARLKRRPAKPYTPARTPDGQPDLQGFWTNSTYTPLERPDNVTKEFYTPEELAGRHQAGGRTRTRADRARHDGRRPL